MDGNNPVWREYLKAIIRIQIDAGVADVEFDEADLPIFATGYAGCFCKDCMKLFRAYLQQLPEDELPQAGKVLYAGNSNFAGWHIVQANEAPRARHLLGLVSEQCKYNLTVRSVELEVLPACERYGLGVIPYSPLAGGFPCGALQRSAEGRMASEQTRSEIERRRGQLEAHEKLCADRGESPPDVALAWLANPVVTAPIIGPRTVVQLDGTLRALEVTLADEILSRLDEFFPGPGGPAPEAWALVIRQR